MRHNKIVGYTRFIVYIACFSLMYGVLLANVTRRSGLNGWIYPFYDWISTNAEWPKLAWMEKDEDWNSKEIT